jgi:hypothetical protein
MEDLNIESTSTPQPAPPSEAAETRHKPSTKRSVSDVVKAKLAEVREQRGDERAPEAASTADDQVKRKYIAEGKDVAPEPAQGEKDSSKSKDTAEAEPTTKSAKPEKSEKSDTSEDLPNSWSKKEREALEKADPELRKVIARRERQRDEKLLDTTRSLAYAEKALKKLEPLTEHYKAVEAEAKRIGQKPAELVQNLLAIQKMSVEDPIRYAATAIANDPPTMIKELAKMYKIDLYEMVRGNDVMAFDREEYQQRQHLERLAAENARLRQQQEEAQLLQQRSQTDAATRSVALVLDEVLSGKDPDEAAEVLPYLDRAAEVVTADAQRKGENLSVKQVIERAYEHLVWATPSLREKQLQRQADEDRRRREDELSRSRAAGISPSGHRPAVKGRRRLEGTLKQKVGHVVRDYIRNSS